MNFLHQALAYIFTAANWTGPAGLGMRLLEHLEYTGIAVLCSALVAIPVGMYVGHTGRGTALVVGGVNALRALPTLGVLLLGVLLWGLGLVPPTVALMLLGIPPLLAGTYAGIANVDPVVVDAARAMGMGRWQIMARIVLPSAIRRTLPPYSNEVVMMLHSTSLASGESTCIDCHKGIAHQLPDMTGVKGF